MRTAVIFTLLLSLVVPVTTFGAPSVPDTTRLIETIEKARAIYLGNPDSAILLVKQALEASGSFRPARIEGFAFYVLSKAYWVKANYLLSTEYGFKALKIYENHQQFHPYGKALVSLARTFIDMGDLQQGRTFLKQAWSVARVANDSLLMAEMQREYSFLLSQTKQYDSALLYTDCALKYFMRHNRWSDIHILYMRKARIWYEQKRYDKSKQILQRCFAMHNLTNNKRALGIAYLLNAENALALNHVDSARIFLLNAIPPNAEVHNLGTLVKVHTLLSDVYSRSGNHALAVDHLKQASAYKDTLYNAEKNGHIQEMQTLYDLERKDLTIRSLAQENLLNQKQVRVQRWLMIVLGIGILLLIALSLALARLRKIQAKANTDLSHKNDAIEKQKEQIREQALNLYDLNQLKLKLFSVISHDLRGPVANLYSLLELLTHKKMTAEEFLIISEKLKGHLNITQRTLENLLNWSLSQMEGLKTERKNFFLAEVVNDSCKLLEEYAVKKDVHIHKDIQEDIQVIADANQVQLILRNLIHNAIKFSKRHGHIVVKAAASGDMCRITVQDSGIGLTSEEVATIVNSRKHFTKTGTQQETGTGLGLLLCQEFIQKNGGQFYITSVPGEGTEISFTIPLAPVTIKKVYS